jgi:cytochrome c biogenesis protein
VTELRAGAQERTVADVPPAAPTRPAPGPGRWRGAVGWLRWIWRQLTSMRTALILLFLLALASVPGSVIPQEGIDPAAVSQYYTAHPSLAPILNKLSLFSVFGAPWFAAIYLLLFLSLAGCVLPRTFKLAGSARQQPPRAPRNLARLPMSSTYQTAMAPDEALAGVSAYLAGKRFRLRTGDGWVSGEKGYLREVGNLIFHIALLFLLASVGIGGIFGYKADRLLISGQSFANTVTDLDQFRPGRLVSPGDLQPFTMSLTSFRATYVTSGNLRGEPNTFDASIRYSPRPGAPSKPYLLKVNSPLRVDGVRVFLVGHGYAPVFKITDGRGKVVFNQAVPFIPVEQSGLTSEGVIKVPDAQPDQLGFAGVFLPTAVDTNGQLSSAFPAAELPRVSLVSYAGNLGLDSGAPQSVYDLDTSHLRLLDVAPRPLAPGQSMRLPGNAGTLTFTGYRQWASLAITYDPGQLPALASGILAIAGLLLSFAVRRRRVFARVADGPDGTLVTVGGLARSDAAGGFEVEFDSLATEIRESQDGHPAASPTFSLTSAAGAAAAAGSPASGSPADVAAAAGSAAAGPTGASSTATGPVGLSSPTAATGTTDRGAVSSPGIPTGPAPSAGTTSLGSAASPTLTTGAGDGDSYDDDLELDEESAGFLGDPDDYGSAGPAASRSPARGHTVPYDAAFGLSYDEDAYDRAAHDEDEDSTASDDGPAPATSKAAGHPGRTRRRPRPARTDPEPSLGPPEGE